MHSYCLKQSVASLQELEWFHPTATRHVAECLLMQNGRDGSYLLRPSTRSDTIALSVRGQDSVKHYVVYNLGFNRYRLGHVIFSSIDELLEHFRSQPLLAGESGLLSALSHPYPRQVTEPSQYEVIRIQAQMGSSKSSRPLDDLNLTMSSKEGFLIKRGGRVKTWKLRWCVLKKMEFKYYEQRMDLEPIRVLDLRHCQGCVLVSAMQNHHHCFRMVFPWRIFYFSTSTAAEAKEWVDLIQWKLARNNEFLLGGTNGVQLQRGRSQPRLA